MSKLRVTVCLLVSLGIVVPTFAADTPAKDKPSDQAAELLVGKWEFKEKKPGLELTITFEKPTDKEGKLKVEVSGLTVDGTYKLLSAEEIEVNLKQGNDMVKQKLKIKVTKDELETTDEQGKVESFKRVK